MAIDTSKEKILIVDDETIIRRLVKTKLSRAGYDCCEAGDVSEALCSLDSERPELMLLDIMMPGRSGVEMLPEVAASHPETAVVIATAVVETETIITCLMNGVQDYLNKPFDLDNLVNSIQRALKLKKLETEIRHTQYALGHENQEQPSEIRRRFFKHIEELVDNLESNDKYTNGHSSRVTNLSMEIARVIGLPETDREDLYWAALLHDVGKIAIDPRIINRPGLLTPYEYRHVLTHATIGAGIVKPLAGPEVIESIAHHHDRFDGSGLCQTVAGEEIPIGARIIAVADAFDAMTSERPFRAAMPVEQALAEIRQCSGSQFDPMIAGALPAVLDYKRVCFN